MQCDRCKNKKLKVFMYLFSEMQIAYSLLTLACFFTILIYTVYNIILMEWPTLSLHVNPTKLLWKQFDCRYVRNV